MDNIRNPNRWNLAAFTIQKGDQPPFAIHVGVHDRRALEQLMRAGKKGCTLIDNPAPRWFGYIFDLRELGVSIETVHEVHRGPYSGTHARHVLRSCAALSAGGEVAA